MSDSDPYSLFTVWSDRIEYSDAALKNNKIEDIMKDFVKDVEKKIKEIYSKENLELKERIFMLQNRRHFKLRLHGIDVAELNVKYILSNQSEYGSARFSVSTMEEDRVEKICDVLNVSFFKHILKYGEEHSIYKLVEDENYIESFMRHGIDEEAEKILREMLGSEEYKKLMWKALVKESTQNF